MGRTWKGSEVDVAVATKVCGILIGQPDDDFSEFASSFINAQISRSCLLVFPLSRDDFRRVRLSRAYHFDSGGRRNLSRGQYTARVDRSCLLRNLNRSSRGENQCKEQHLKNLASGKSFTEKII